jgi:DNA repair exonuclease SbcCD nuclease subunit
VKTKKLIKHKGKPAYILTSDWHLRGDQPICRKDDFQDKQWKKVDFIFNLSKDFDSPILFSGDLFHKACPNLQFIRECLLKFEKDAPSFYYVLGNHDLKNHNMDLYESSGVSFLPFISRSFHTRKIKCEMLHDTVIEAKEWLAVLTGLNFGEDVLLDENLAEIGKLKKEYRKILLLHEFTYKGAMPFPGCAARTTQKLLTQHKDFDLIVTGDNHQSFSHEDKGRLLVNPGCISRQRLQEIDHIPCVYFYYPESNTVEQIVVPHDKDVFSEEHLKLSKEKEDREVAFVKRLKDNYEINLSFENNLSNYLKSNKVKKEITQKIMEAMQ